MTIREKIAHEIAREKINATLATIIVGDDSASQIYIKNKIAACESVGIKSHHIALPANATEADIIHTINRLNNDSEITGILLQLPLPSGMSAENCIAAIHPDKDVDGLHPENAGQLMMLKTWDDIRRKNIPISCTPRGIIEILDYYGIEIGGKNAVVVGRSNLVGKPIAMLLLSRNATVTIAHSHTKDLPAICRGADILIAAIGAPKFITADMIKPGAVIIDVGINRTDAGIVGDVDFDAAANVAGAITPVPNGVGPMTIAMLLLNTLTAYKKQE